MQTRGCCLLAALFGGLFALVGCSNSSSEDRLEYDNTHSEVFISSRSFDDPEAFADSMMGLKSLDSVFVDDTITVVVNDTVYLMGYVSGNTNKIDRYVWYIEEPNQSSDSSKKDCEYFYGDAPKGCRFLAEEVANATQYAYVFKMVGVYNPLFITIDKNDVRDTAGIGKYIRVINPLPTLSVPKDTLWTKINGSITFPVVAKDSLGAIKSIKIDLDANGMAEANDLDVKKLKNDTLNVTVDFDSKYVDGKGNQKVYIIAKDDDGNEVKDSVDIHFYPKPTLKIVSLFDSVTVDGDSDSEQDTITITVNDTVYFTGTMPSDTDKIKRYVWHVDEPYEVDNAKTFSYAFKEVGVYNPFFITVDKKDVGDTVGANQFIRVVNTIPSLSVPKDTLWTKANGPVTFPVVAKDSLDAIKSIEIDLDASGKAEAKSLDVKKLKNDTLNVTVEFDSKYVDSKGNQKVYIIAKDDDGNEVKDSVNIHFNKKPTLKIVGPLDGSTINDKEYQIFLFDAKDEDNPDALRYFVRASNSVSVDEGSGVTAPEMSDKYLIAENLKEPYYVITDKNGKNQINLSGRIYWDVWVTDGYDTVFVDNIKENGKERPHTFLLVDLKNPMGTFKGVVKREGISSHKGITVEFSNSSNKYVTTTDMLGNYSINVPSGDYELLAYDPVSDGFDVATLSHRHVEIGETRQVEELVLRDVATPVIEIDNYISQTTERNVLFTGRVQDLESGLESVKCVLDGSVECACELKQDSRTAMLSKRLWETELKNLSEGKHSIKWTATDSVGLSSELSFDFQVFATEIVAAIKSDSESDTYQVSYMADQSKTYFEFRAVLKNANPIPDSIFWMSNINSEKIYASLVNKATSTAELKLCIADLSLKPGAVYEMTAFSERNGEFQSNKVRFGIMTAGIPVVYFTKPKMDTTVSIGDLITFDFLSNPNNSIGAVNQSESPILSYEKDGHTTKLDVNSFTPTESGVYKFILSLTNYGDQKTTRDTLVVTVENDPPTLKTTLLVDDPQQIKVNASTPIRVEASDKFGTIEKLEYGCLDGGNPSPVEDLNFVKGQKNVTNYVIQVTAPAYATDDFTCIVRVTDDDGQVASSNISYKVGYDIPVVKMKVDEMDLTINDVAELEFFAMDALGRIDSVQQACSAQKGLTSWETVYRGEDFENGDYTVTMPGTAGKYYCGIRVFDNDGYYAENMTIFNVLKASPSVKIIGSYDNVFVKDQIRLLADARDSTQYKNTILKGRIVEYQWGCAGSSESKIPLTTTSDRPQEYIATMPEKSDSKYRCAVVVTDDDGLTASDTVTINVRAK